MTFLSWFFFHIEIFHLCCNFSTVHFGLHSFFIENLHWAPGFTFLLEVKLIESRCRPVALLQCGKRTMIKLKQFESRATVHQITLLAERGVQRLYKYRLFFFLQFMKLLRSFVQCSIPVFGDKILKCDDGQMNFKSSFKALMEHFSLKRPCVQAMRRV